LRTARGFRPAREIGVEERRGGGGRAWPRGLGGGGGVGGGGGGLGHTVRFPSVSADTKEGTENGTRRAGQLRSLRTKPERRGTFYAFRLPGRKRGGNLSLLSKRSIAVVGLGGGEGNDLVLGK